MKGADLEAWWQEGRGKPLPGLREMAPTCLPSVCVEPVLGHSHVARVESGTHPADLMAVPVREAMRAWALGLALSRH